MIEARHLIKKYGSILAVDDLSFLLEDGRVYGLLGANGAGKSTTMNMLAGYFGPTSGEIRIEGYDLLAEPEKAKKCVGYLPEIPPLYTELTVEEYLISVAEMKKVPYTMRRAMTWQLMEKVEVSERKNRLIRNLSKGYKQRVGIAQAMMGDPRVLILDEPTVGLDPVQLQGMRRLVRELGKDHTVLISSHILSEIAEVCDEILILKAGKLIARGAAEELARLAVGGSQMTLLVECDERTINEILGGLPEILHWETHLEEEKNIRIMLQLEKEADIRKDLFFAFARKQCPILEMSPVSQTLEDTFLELTEDKQ